MRLFSCALIILVLFGISGCEGDKKNSTITPPPPGSSLGTNAAKTSGTGS